MSGRRLSAPSRTSVRHPRAARATARAVKLMAWYQPQSRSRSSSCASSYRLWSSRHRASPTSEQSCSSSTSRISRRSRSSTQHGSAGPPCVSDVTCAASRPARSAKNATCTPHSYSQPQRAQVRSITISRSRSPTANDRPSWWRPQGCIAAVIGGFRTNVRKSAMGGTPGGIIARSCSSSAGSKGGSSGAMRGVWSRSIASPPAFLNPKHLGRYPSSKCFGFRTSDASPHDTITVTTSP